MAVILLIVGMLLGGLLPTLSGQIEQRRNEATLKQLDEIQQALIGYALINGRLPCPASASSNGVESFIGGGSASTGVCSNFYTGFVPAATLALNNTDSAGYAVDAWGNRIHYAVSAWNNVFTMSNGISSTGIANLQPNLLVCSSATGASNTSCAAGMALTASPGVPIVIYSTGKNGSYGGTGADEMENPNPNSNDNDRVFVSHPPTRDSAPNGEFDDLLVWVSPNILINRMVLAGKVP